MSAPADAYEQEADRIADRVMRMPEPQLQRMCACGGFCPDCRKQQASDVGPQPKHAQASAAAATSAPAVVLDALRSPGHPLDSETRATMQPYFWYDLSSIQVHTGGRAARSAYGLNVLAYTIGSHIVFGNGACSRNAARQAPSRSRACPRRPAGGRQHRRHTGRAEKGRRRDGRTTR